MHVGVTLHRDVPCSRGGNRAVVIEGGTHAKNDKRRFMARARTTGLMRPGFDAEQD